MVSPHRKALCLPISSEVYHMRHTMPPSVPDSNKTNPDRPLIRIKRKGRPFATCIICNAIPCTAPIEHARAKRDAEFKCPKVTQTRNTTSTARIFSMWKKRNCKCPADCLFCFFFLEILPFPRKTPSAAEYHRFPSYCASS